MIPTGGVSQLSGCCPPYGYHFRVAALYLSDDQAFFNGIEICIEKVSSLSSIAHVPL